MYFYDPKKIDVNGGRDVVQSRIHFCIASTWKDNSLIFFSCTIVIQFFGTLWGLIKPGSWAALDLQAIAWTALA